MKKLSKILSILLMVAVLVTINFDVYAKSRSGGFKSSSHSSSSSSKSSSSSSSGGFKSSSGYSKHSTSTTSKPSTSTKNSTSTSSVNRSGNNNRSFMPMIFFGNSVGSSMLRYFGLFVIILIIYFVYKARKRRH